MVMTKENWKESFKVKYRNFSYDEKDAANGWGCCAVGCRLTEDYNINTEDISINKLLTPKAVRLGKKFYDYVESNNVEKAEKCFNQIQEMEEFLRVEGKRYYPWDAYF